MALKTDRDSSKIIIFSKYVIPAPTQSDLSLLFTFLSATTGVIIGLIIASFIDLI